MSKVRLASAVLKTVGGGTPARNNPEFWNGGIPWASVKDFKDGSYNLATTQEEISEKGLKMSASHLIPAGTPIVCTRMAVGRIAQANRPVAINQDLRALYVHNHFDSNYLILALDSIRPQIENLAVGSTVKGINIEHLLNFEIFGPPKPEQTKIAEILSTLGRAIEQTEALIAKQQRIKTGLMQDLLTRGIDEHGNLRSEHTHAFKDSPLGRIPVEWEARRLDWLATDVIDCPHTTPSFLPEGVLVARTFNLKDGRFVGERHYVSGAEYTTRVSRLEPRSGDLIFTREAPVGEAFVIPPGLRICLGQRTMLIRCDTKSCLPEYFLEVVYSEEMRIRFDQMVGGTTNPHLNVGVVRALLVRQPPTSEQVYITKLIGTIRRVSEQGGLQLTKLYALKTALMQDLLTGKKRVTSLLKPVPTN